MPPVGQIEPVPRQAVQLDGLVGLGARQRGGDQLEAGGQLRVVCFGLAPALVG